MRIAIVGSGPNWIEAPFDDLEYQVWTYGPLAVQLPRVDLVFEVHKFVYWPRFIKPTKPTKSIPEYIQKLNSLGKPIVTMERVEGLNSDLYPIEEVCSIVGPHICSSVGWMLGFAALLQTGGEQIEEIALFGLDLDTYEEWADQRPNTNRLIGFLQGRGVRVTVPPSSKLFGRPFLYGLTVPEDSPHTAQHHIEEDIRQMTALMYRWADHTYALKVAEEAKEKAA